MKITDFKKLEKSFGCKFKVQKTGSADWVRRFILDSRGCTIGRLSFYEGRLSNIKNYKRDYHDTLCETDQIFFRLERYLADKYIMPLDIYIKLKKEAQEIKEKDYQEKITWRKTNPLINKDGNPGRRKKLQGKNIRFILRELVMNYQIKEKGDKMENPKPPEDAIRLEPPPRPPEKKTIINCNTCLIAKKLCEACDDNYSNHTQLTEQTACGCKAGGGCAKKKKKKRSKNTGVVIEYQVLSDEKILIVGLQGLHYQQLPKGYIQSVDEYIYIENYVLSPEPDKLIIRRAYDGYGSRALLIVGKICKRDKFENAIKIIRSCGKSLHQWNKNIIISKVCI
jgi:hypothetical protein